MLIQWSSKYIGMRLGVLQVERHLLKRGENLDPVYHQVYAIKSPILAWVLENYNWHNFKTKVVTTPQLLNINSGFGIEVFV